MRVRVRMMERKTFRIRQRATGEGKLICPPHFGLRISRCQVTFRVSVSMSVRVSERVRVRVGVRVRVR